MGRSADIYIYDADELRRNIILWVGEEVTVTVKQLDLINNILSSCGLFAGDRYIILSNDYAEDANPQFSAFALLDSAFKGDKKEDAGDIFYKTTYKRGVSYADRYDLAENFQITILEED